jgi:hypothetical protein
MAITLIHAVFVLVAVEQLPDLAAHMAHLHHSDLVVPSNP